MFIHEKTLAELEKVLKLLAEKGEDKMYEYHRKKVWNSFCLGKK